MQRINNREYKRKRDEGALYVARVYEIFEVMIATG